jgi:hypothetical protein
MGGLPPPQVAAFNVIFDEPNAAELFEEVAHQGDIAGRLYALSGLMLLGNDVAAGRLEEAIRSGDQKVNTQFGCVGGEEKASKLIDAIKSYSYGADFRRVRERTFAYYDRPDHLCADR